MRDPGAPIPSATIPAMEGLVIARERPMYTASEVARWAKTSSKTVRRWVAGYRFLASSGERWSPPVTRRRAVDEPFLTFEDLVEVAAVAAIRKAEVPMPRIRAAVEYVQSELRIDRPLLSARFLTDGRDLFLRDSFTAPHFTNASRVGQVAWSELEEILREVDYADDLLAARWWPAGRLTGIVVDPQINFGRPVVATLGVRTETLVDRFVAGLTPEDVAEEYRTDPLIIQHAIRFENRSGAIAA